MATKIEWHVGKGKPLFGQTTTTIIITNGQRKWPSQLAIVRNGRNCAVRIYEGSGNHKITTSFPAGELADAIAAVAAIMDTAEMRSNGKIVGRVQGTPRVLLEVNTDEFYGWTPSPNLHALWAGYPIAMRI